MQRASDEDNLKIYSALAGTDAFVEDDTVTFSTKNGFAYGVLNKDAYHCFCIHYCKGNQR